MDKRGEFFKRLLATFKIEAQEHRETVDSGLVQLESATEERRPALIETVFRAVHSLKGAARAVNQSELESACHLLENVFAHWKRQKTAVPVQVYDSLHRVTDLLGHLIAMSGTQTPNSPPEEKARELLRQVELLINEGIVSLAPLPALSDEAPTEPERAIASSLAHWPVPPSVPAAQPVVAPVTVASIADLEKLREVIREESAPPKPPAEPARAPSPEASPADARQAGLPAFPQPPPASAAPPVVPPPEKSGMLETIRVSTAKLDNLLLQTEELLATKQAAAYLSRNLPRLQADCLAWKKAWTKLQPSLRAAPKSAIQKVSPDGWQDIHKFLEWNHEFMETMAKDLGEQSQAAVQNQRASTLLIDGLIEEMKKVLMRPFASVVEGLPRVARDLARDLGKEVEMIIRCGEIDMDRRTLEELKDPLTHLIRNCVDHGIEKPADRLLKQKRPRGTIAISLEQISGREVQLVVADDGRGMDVARIRATAVEKGLLGSDQAGALSDQASIALAFQSGLSTSPIITDISGRGLGLAIVRERVERLGGRIIVDSKPGQGTSFTIRLPATRATFRGVIVRVAEEVFVFPTTSVDRVVRVKKTGVQPVEGRESIQLNGQIISLVRLRDLLGVEVRQTKEEAMFPVVVASANSQTMAFAVDEVINEHEVLVKSLGPQLPRVRNIEGATVLEGGRLAPILHLPDLMKTAVAAGAFQAAQVEAQAESFRRKKILVVEDSITSRILLKNILEAAHYEVQTAVDGLDGFTKLRDGHFDLVVSDVEMPRLHGFDLTARIRADQQLAGLPVILVTARESREDREKGVEAGANAYIVKSSFDQSNLLEVVQRLI